jgi:hypothetical protein
MPGTSPWAAVIGGNSIASSSGWIRPPVAGSEGSADRTKTCRKPRCRASPPKPRPPTKCQRKSRDGSRFRHTRLPFPPDGWPIRSYFRSVRAPLGIIDFAPRPLGPRPEAPCRDVDRVARVVHQRRKRIVSPQKTVEHHCPRQDRLPPLPQTFDPGCLPGHASIDRTGRHGFETKFMPVGHQRDIDPASVATSSCQSVRPTVGSIIKNRPSRASRLYSTPPNPK